MSIRCIPLGVAFALLLVAVPALAAEGDPVPGADVSIEQVPGGIRVAQTQTDETGTAVFTGLKPGSYVARCKSGPCRGKILKSFTVTTSAPVTVSVKAPARVAN